MTPAPMLIPFLALSLVLALLTPTQGQPQQPAPKATQPSVSPAASDAKPPAASLTSATLQPAIDALRNVLILVRVEKWKTSNPIRDTTSANLDSIQRDLDNTLPPLVKVADAAPNSVTTLLPVFRNINALYDVLLRVSGAADIAAPRPQADGLHQAVTTLDQSRRNLGDTLQSNAATQEDQLASLQSQLAAAKAAAIPPPPPPPAPTPTKPKPKTKKKPTT